MVIFNEFLIQRPVYFCQHMDLSHVINIDLKFGKCHKVVDLKLSYDQFYTFVSIHIPVVKLCFDNFWYILKDSSPAIKLTM